LIAINYEGNKLLCGLFPFAVCIPSQGILTRLVVPKQPE